jgi:hypothetical protein
MMPAGCVGSQPVCGPLLAAAVVVVVVAVVSSTRVSEIPKTGAWRKNQQMRLGSEA